MLTVYDSNNDSYINPSDLFSILKNISDKKIIFMEDDINQICRYAFTALNLKYMKLNLKFSKIFN